MVLEILHNNEHTLVESKRLVYSIIIVAITVLIETVGGLISHSLALLSDAGHILGDFFALVISWMAHKFSNKKSDLQRSYGYHRLQIIAAFINGLTLFFIVVIIISQSIKRLFSSVSIEWEIMFIIALFGLTANILVFSILHSKCKSNLNIKSAMLHVIGDILGSIAAILASIIIMFTGWQAIDPILSIFVSIIMLSSSYRILKNSCHILLEGTPESISPEKIKSQIMLELPEVVGVHHIHAWSLSERYFITTMHAKVNKQNIKHSDILYGIKKVLLNRFKIVHSTIEIEYEDCCVDDKIPTSINKSS